jgi:CspA family cold shock protein
MAARLTGTVRFFREDKGYGFIVIDGTRDNDKSKDLFVHSSQVVEDEPLQPGDRVSFIQDRGNKGPVARAVTRI